MVAAPETLDTAAATLADAFQGYPMFVRCLTDPTGRRAGLPIMWRAMGRQFSALPHGTVDLVGDGRGAAIWGDGDQCDIGLLQGLRYGHVRFAAAAGVVPALRLMRLQERITEVHRTLVTEPHLYLAAIGVHTSSQGKGLGTELLRRGHARADAIGMPCYLETNVERDARLYTREGYITLRRQDVGGLDTWFMLRPVG